MRGKPQITFRNVSPSETLEAVVRSGIDHMDSLFGENIRSYGITVSVPHRHRHKGLLYDVKIRIGTRAGETIVVGKVNEDPHHAINLGLIAARRRISDCFRRKARYSGHHNLWGEPRAA